MQLRPSRSVLSWIPARGTSCGPNRAQGASGLRTGASPSVGARPASREEGFTARELLAVVGGLALIATLWLPGLWAGGEGGGPAGWVRGRAWSMVCENHGRQLMLGWQLYAGDHAGRVVNNFGVAETLAEISQLRFRTWANNVMTWGTESYCTNLGLAQRGVFAPYVGNALRLLKCPADVYLSPQQQTKGVTQRPRSVAMNGYCGPFDANPRGTWSRGRNPFDAAYRQYLKVEDVPEPARLFVAIEEHPNSINEGYFLNVGSSRVSGWGDAPGTYHAGGCVVSFADGHIESKRWTGAWVKAASMTRIPSTYSPPLFDQGGRADFEWLFERTSSRVEANSRVSGESG